MSYPVRDPVQLAPVTVVAGQYAAVLSVLSGYWANDDWIFLAVCCSATTGTLSTATSGWSEVVELDVTSGLRMGVYKAKVTSGTVADPTVSLSSGTALWSVFAWCERDADTTDPTPSGYYATADAGSVASLDSGALTPGVNNCRIVYIAATRGSSDNYMRMLDADAVGDSLLNITDGSVSLAAMVASSAQNTAATTVKKVYNSVAMRTGVITLAIKPGTAGKRARHASSEITRLAWMGSFGATHDGTLTPATSSWGAPTSRTLSGVTVSTTAATRITNSTAGPNEWGTYDNNACTLATAGWQGNMLTFAADVDMTGKLFALEWNSPAFASQVGDKGLVVVFEDNAGTNWEAFQLSQKVGFQWTKEYGTVIDLENATPYDSGGTLDWTLVRKVTFLLHRSGVSAAARSFSLKNMLLIGKTTLVGGNDSRPLDINYLRQVLHGMGYVGLVGGEAPAVTLRSDVQIGDTGTTITYYDATGTLHAFPEAYDALTQREVNIPANKIDLTIDAGPDDTINFTATSISATLEQNLTFAAGTDAAASYSMQGASIIGMLATGRTAVPQTGATYSGCDEVAFGGADVTNATIVGTTSANAACSFDANGVVLATSTIDLTGTNAAHHIALGAAVTAITLNGVTLTGTPATDKVYSALASGTLTITLDGTGTSLVAGDVTFVGGSTATAVIASPTVNQKVIVSGFTAGSRIQIYDTTSATELFNGTASAGNTVVSGTTATWTDPSAASADRAIRVRISYVSGVTAKEFHELTGLTCGQTAGTATVTYPDTPVNDTTYNNNAIDGPAIYATSGITFTDASPDLVNISIAGGAVTWPTIYACFVYWIFTATGIDDDVAYIQSPDTANYLLTNMKLKNTHTNPLKVTGGYGRSATTGLVADIIDSAGSTGNIFPSPDHVVAYATGSGALTAGDITNIWANSSRTLTATQDANIVKVNGVTVDGVGTDANPWGPV